MYHVKKDKRSQTSAKLIIEGLNSCLKKKSFQEITITDIQRKSTVGRATFYRLFDNLTDVLAYQCDQQFVNAMEIDKDNLSYEEHIRHFICCWMKEADLLETIIQSGHMELIYQAHNKSAEALKTRFLENADIPEKDSDYFLHIMPNIMIGILTAWVKRGKVESTEDLINLLKQASLVNYQLLIQKTNH